VVRDPVAQRRLLLSTRAVGVEQRKQGNILSRCAEVLGHDEGDAPAE
jgi:hypothetical protein